MTISVKIHVYDDDHVWHVAYGLHGQDGDILVSAESVHDLSDEQIGKAVRAALERVDFCRALYYATQVPWGIEQFITHYKESGELESILADLEQYKDEDARIAIALEKIRIGPVRRPRETKESRRKRVQGYVYVLRSDHGYKIGKTQDLRTRMSAFTLQLPFPTEMIHSIESDDYTAAEDYVHERFASKRINGEWFNLDEHDLQWLMKTTNLIFAKKSEKQQ